MEGYGNENAGEDTMSAQAGYSMSTQGGIFDEHTGQDMATSVKDGI